MKKLPGDLPQDPGPYHLLAVSIRRNADAGYLPNCSGSTWPTSDDPDERARAATELCPGCPVADECDTAGQSESHHVWAATDRTPDRSTTTRRPRRRIREELAA